MQSVYGITEAFPNLSFSQPVGLYHAGDGTNRLFLVAQEGEIYVFENSENVQNANLFLDINDRVLFGGEQGLLGLAFHPNYSSNGFFYVDYTAENPRRTVISRFSASQGNPNQADENSEQVILEVAQPYSNHNGGQIAFGPDGYLYVAFGDGGSGGDPEGNGQGRSTLLGAILRIDVDMVSEGRDYGIPVGNPFVGNTQGYKEEIYAYGLRNPWRFSFDPVTGWLWTGDVGQDRLEEIDIIESGRNYGWNIMEASLCYSPSEGCNRTGLELPLWDYGRDLGVSVTGGFVYRGSMFPDLVGAYIYGDYGSGRIWALEYNGVDDPVNMELLSTNLNIASFGVDAKNELYICAFDNKIYKLTSIATAPEISEPIQTPLEPMPDEAVTVTVDVTADNGVQEVILSYSDNAVWTNITMSHVVGDTHTADIPAMPDQTQVRYRIIAYDNFDNVAVKDNLGNFYNYMVIPEFPSIAIFTAIFIIGTLVAVTRKLTKKSKA
jgi:glucose/arabinose dehydrogenase